MSVPSSANDPTRTASSFLFDLEAVLRSRQVERPERSYSVKLFDDPTLVQRKIMEEAFEVCLELQAQPNNADLTANEAADLIYHLLVGLVSSGVAWSEVEAVLRDRHSDGSAGA